MPEIDWSDLDNAHIKPQSATAIYRDDYGYVVIRQRNEDRPDTLVKISANNLGKFIDRLIEIKGELASDE